MHILTVMSKSRTCTHGLKNVLKNVASGRFSRVDLTSMQPYLKASRKTTTTTTKKRRETSLRVSTIPNLNTNRVLVHTLHALS